MFFKNIFQLLVWESRRTILIVVPHFAPKLLPNSPHSSLSSFNFIMCLEVLLLSILRRQVLATASQESQNGLGELPSKAVGPQASQNGPVELPSISSIPEWPRWPALQSYGSFGIHLLSVMVRSTCYQMLFIGSSAGLAGLWVLLSPPPVLHKDYRLVLLGLDAIWFLGPWIQVVT